MITFLFVVNLFLSLIILVMSFLLWKVNKVVSMKEKELEIDELFFGDTAATWLKNLPVKQCSVCGDDTLWDVCPKHDERDPDERNNTR